MKHLLDEYGLALLAVVTALAMMGMLLFQMSAKGDLWQLILYWIYASC